jgi:T5SS/PEP-CTERM-associated repeat protein
MKNKQTTKQTFPNRRLSSFIKVIGIAAFVWAFPQTTSAQTIWFAGTGNWTTASNWTAGVPTSVVNAELSMGIAQLSGANLGIANRITLGTISGTTGRIQVFSVGNGIPALNANDLRVGSSGTGFLDITLGGRVFSPTNAIGLFASSNGTVNINGFNPNTGSQSTWFAEGGTFDVGYAGTGVLNVTNSGLLRTNSASVGTTGGANGTVLLAGTSSTKWIVNNGNLNIGIGGTGKVTLADQAQIEFTGTGRSIVIGSNGIFNFGFKSTNGLGTPGAITNAASIVNGGAFNFDHTGTVAISTPISGAGQITQIADGTTTLSNTVGFGGSVLSSAGLLTIQGMTGATSLTADGTGTLRLQNGSLALGSNSIRANGSGVVEYQDKVINGGFLRGSGIHKLNASSTNTFNGVTTFNSTQIVQNGVGNFNNFYNGGSFINNAVASFDGAVNTSSGYVQVNSTLNTVDFTTQGEMRIFGGGQIVNTMGNLTAAGGSRTELLEGGIVSLQNGTELNLHGALIINNGTIDGTTNVHFGSLAKGAGDFGTVNVFDGGTFSPGNSPGQATLAAATFLNGGTLLFEVHDALGDAGVGYDTLNIAGELMLNAGITFNSQFSIKLASLDAFNLSGLAVNFDPTQSYSFVLATALGGINGFSQDQFRIDMTHFQNDLGSGSFSVSTSGNHLLLNFSAVPEPTSLLLVWVCAIGVSCQRRRWIQPANHRSGV